MNYCAKMSFKIFNLELNDKILFHLFENIIYLKSFYLIFLYFPFSFKKIM